MEDKGIEYIWLGEELRGYRREGLGEEPPNKAWNSRGFRNHADHTLTEEFKQGIEKLLSYAKNKKSPTCVQKNSTGAATEE